MKIGAIELLVIFVVALLVIGPDKLPYYMKQLGKGLASFRKATDEATSEIRKNVVEPLEEAQKPLREAMEPVEELHKAVTGDMKELTDSINNIGKPKKSGAKKAEAVKAAADPAERAADAAEELPKTEAAAETVKASDPVSPAAETDMEAKRTETDETAPSEGPQTGEVTDTEAIRKELAQTAETLRRLQAQLEAAEGKKA